MSEREVEIESFVSQTGFAEKTVRDWMKRQWTEGVEFKNNNGAIIIDSAAVMAWAFGKPIPRDRPRKAYQDAPTALYRHFSAAGELLYVGIALSPLRRLATHRKSGWCNDIARVEIERFLTRDLAMKAERAAIQSEKPLYNKMHANVAH